MTCANVLVGLGKDREGMETGDAGREDGDAAICVAPRRERPAVQRHRDDNAGISIHAPAKGATLGMVALNTSKAFQSTLPRRERLFGFNRTLDRPRISIHAPAKGATASILVTCSGD